MSTNETIRPIRNGILTCYSGPTDTRGARVYARSEGHSLSLPWDHAHNAESNHRLAALALASRLGWTHRAADLAGCAIPGRYDYAFAILTD